MEGWSFVSQPGRDTHIRYGRSALPSASGRSQAIDLFERNERLPSPRNTVDDYQCLRARCMRRFDKCRQTCRGAAVYRSRRNFLHGTESLRKDWSSAVGVRESKCCEYLNVRCEINCLQ